MANIRTQFTIPFGDGEPPNFFLKNRAPSSKPQASSNRQQAGGWAHRRQAVDIMGFSGMINYDFAGPTMSRQNCLSHTRRARPWSFRRWTNFTRVFKQTKLKEIRPVRRSHPFPKIENRKATSNRRQASSVKRQATSIPAFGYRREGGPIGYKLLDRGP